jgi:glycosyltransferase involved in cell wall biosynthesis
VTKPTVLVIISHYLPGEKVGGPVRTTSNMVEWLGDDFDFRILTTDRDVGDTAPYPDIEYGAWHPVGKAKVRYLAPAEQSLLRLRNLINFLTYDVIYLDALFAPFTLKVLFLRRLGLLPAKSIILVPRGQWRPEAMRIKSRKKRVFMSTAKVIGLYSNLHWHASSEAERSDIEHMIGGQTRDIRVIPNLPLPPSSASELHWREKQIGSCRLVFLARIVRNKGLGFLLENLHEVRGCIELDIYGHQEDKQHWQECEEMIAHLPSNITATYKGIVRFDRVISTLSQYHLFILPTLSENFGQVILEALVAGCPVLISDRTPWQNLDGAAWVLPLENEKQWKEALQSMVDMGQDDFDQMAFKASGYGKEIRCDSNVSKSLRDYLGNVAQ